MVFSFRLFVNTQQNIFVHKQGTQTNFRLLELTFVQTLLYRDENLY